MLRRIGSWEEEDEKINMNILVYENTVDRRDLLIAEGHLRLADVVSALDMYPPHRSSRRVGLKARLLDVQQERLGVALITVSTAGIGEMDVAAVNMGSSTLDEERFKNDDTEMDGSAADDALNYGDDFEQSQSEKTNPTNFEESAIMKNTDSNSVGAESNNVDAEMETTIPADISAELLLVNQEINADNSLSHTFNKDEMPSVNDALESMYGADFEGNDGSANLDERNASLQKMGYIDVVLSENEQTPPISEAVEQFNPKEIDSIHNLLIADDHLPTDKAMENIQIGEMGFEPVEISAVVVEVNADQLIPSKNEVFVELVVQQLDSAPNYEIGDTEIPNIEIHADTTTGMNTIAVVASQNNYPEVSRQQPQSKIIHNLRVQVQDSRRLEAKKHDVDEYKFVRKPPVPKLSVLSRPGSAVVKVTC